MFINMFSMDVVHVTIMKIVGVAVVYHRFMPTLRAVRVSVGGVLFA
jgi:hypothetical protein